MAWTKTEEYGDANMKCVTYADKATGQTKQVTKQGGKTLTQIFDKNGMCISSK